MKKILTSVIALSLSLVAWGQNPMDRPMETFPTVAETHLMCQAAWNRLQGNPACAPELATAALQSGNRQYSNAVLGYVDETAGPKAIVKAVQKVYPSLPDAAKADVLYWIGRNKLAVLQKFVDEGVRAAQVSEASMAAAFAAVQMGGKHNQELLDKCVKSGSPLAPEIRRLRGLASGDDDDSTRNALRDHK